MRSFPRLAGLSLATLLAACLGGDQDADIVTSYFEQVLDIDRGEKTFTTRQVYQYCEEGATVSDTTEWDRSYHLQGGKLYLWYDYACRASVSRGTGSDIVGTWTADPPDLEAIPGGGIGDCDAQGIALEERFNGFNRNLIVKSEISETQFKSTYTGEYCWAEYYAWSLPWDEGEEIETSQENCSSVNLTRSSDDLAARLTSDETSATYAIKFTTAGTSCSVTLPQNTGEPDCGAADPWDDFEECVYGSGYFGDEGLEKKGLSKAVRRALHVRR